MRVRWNPRRVPGRRLAGWSVLAALLFLLLRPPGGTTRAPVPVARPAPERTPTPLPEPGIVDLEMSGGLPLELRPPPEVPPDALAPPPSPATPPPAPAPATVPPPEEPVAEATAPVLEPVATLLREPTDDASTSAGAPDDETADGEVSQVNLRVLVVVQPRYPTKVKRKIDDAVIVQTRVGSDGRVREVRVLQSIANCDECNQSAIEAVEQYVYDAPTAAGVDGVWTEPVRITFKLGR